MAYKGIAYQLYSARNEAAEDLEGTLAKLKAIGWDYVQWSGMPKLPADEIRAVLDRVGLKAIAAHVQIPPFEENFEAEVAFWKTVGALDVAPGAMMPDCTGSLEAWLNGAQRLEALGAKLNDVGMRLSFHNHAKEFDCFEGESRCKLDLLYESTDPKNLYTELDTAWVYEGKADPAAYIRKYAGRSPLLHCKDLTGEYDPDHPTHPIFTELGCGKLDWPDIFAAAKEACVEWYIYEQDNAGGEADLFQSARISYEFLKEHLE